MKLHENPELFQQAIRYTADSLKILPIYVEKDYWVTYALWVLFSSEVAAKIVFKGGTSLAKCYGLIDRFSEDIDLVIIREQNESDNQAKQKLKKIEQIISEKLPEMPIENLTHRTGKIRKTAHSYQHYFSGDYAQARDFIVLESTWLGYFEPFESKKISSLIGLILAKNHQSEIITQYDLGDFPVNVLMPSRTLCEKIMSLVRFSYDPNPITALRNKIRHIYDIHQLLSRAEYRRFFDGSEFEKMLVRVARDDIHSFKNNNQWLSHHPVESLVFKDETIWEQLEFPYQNEFGKLVYGNLPNFNDIRFTFEKLKTRLAKIKQWDIVVKKQG
ncbi:nucleotidyl transferase AbiEii/AbiGii toxin family protein [Lonepinella koalarum]|uniref:nucleotidyl transferase AbiEii/AbiGii toxin family protein n=1 Tax=Lonepinella koalarum TaxID=53417 RepID=UPI003F6DFC5D